MKKTVAHLLIISALTTTSALSFISVQAQTNIVQKKDAGYCVDNSSNYPYGQVVVSEGIGFDHYLKKQWCSSKRNTTLNITVYAQGNNPNCQYYRIPINAGMRGPQDQYPWVVLNNNNAYLYFYVNKIGPNSRIINPQIGPNVGDCSGGGGPMKKQ